MKWQYDGSTKKELKSRWRTKTVEIHKYTCPYCRESVMCESGDKPPLHCPSCGANMRGEYHG